jgi:hypothetical protein
MPQHLQRWVRPRCYVGAEWPEYYSAGVGQSRDFDCLERSNFVAMLAALGGESGTVQVVRESHWAVGWVEWIAIHESDETALRAADEQQERLENYPVLDEDDWSRREWEGAAETWDRLTVGDRIATFRRHGYSADSFGQLLCAVRDGDWSEAGRMFHHGTDVLC